MSRIIYNLSEFFDVVNDIHIVVPSLQLKFSDFVRRQINEKDLSYRKVAQRSGGILSHSTVGDIINEKVSNISVDVIVGLAKGIGITEQELFDVARGKPPNVSRIANERFEFIAEGYAKIPEASRSNLEPLIFALEKTIESGLAEAKLSTKEILLGKYPHKDSIGDNEQIEKPLRRKAS